MFRRAKLMLADVPEPHAGEVTARVDLTDELRHAPLRPPPPPCPHLGADAHQFG